MSNLIPDAHRTKTVQFSGDSILHVIEPKADVEGFWYSRRDHKVMGVLAKHDAAEARQSLFCLLSDHPSIGGGGSARSVQESVTLTGLENLITANAIERTKECRARRLRAVLEEQERSKQDHPFGTDDSVGIARVAFRHSESATKRAHKNAMILSKQVADG